MEANWYAVQQHAHDRITEARAVARAHALMRELAPPHRGRYAVGIALIRLGGWLLTSGAALPIELSRALANLRAGTDNSLRVSRSSRH
jgi:hypothetical protein